MNRDRHGIAATAPLIVALGIVVAGCAAQPRAPGWTCMQKTMDRLVLAGLPDPRKHCVAAGAITQRCGSLSAFAAGYGKEVADVFGPGDAERADLAADRAGRACGKQSAGVDALTACCVDAGY